MGIDLVVIKCSTTVRNQVVRGAVCSFSPGIPTAWGGMLDQTLSWGSLQGSLPILLISSVIGRFSGKEFYGTGLIII